MCRVAAAMEERRPPMVEMRGVVEVVVPEFLVDDEDFHSETPRVAHHG